MPLFLDTGVLGLVTHPAGGADASACLKWMRDCIEAGSIVCIAEIVDYELRRELIRRKSGALAKLDALPQPPSIQYLPLTTPVMRDAAQLWALMRNRGTPTAPHHALDGDVILAAQVTGFASASGGAAIVATTDVGDLTRLQLTAKRWEDVPVGRY